MTYLIPLFCNVRQLYLSSLNFSSVEFSAGGYMTPCCSDLQLNLTNFLYTGTPGRVAKSRALPSSLSSRAKSRDATEWDEALWGMACLWSSAGFYSLFSFNLFLKWGDLPDWCLIIVSCLLWSVDCIRSMHVRKTEGSILFIAILIPGCLEAYSKSCNNYG